MVLPAYFYILLVTFRSQNLILFYSIDTLISNISKRRCNMEFRIKWMQQNSLITQRLEDQGLNVSATRAKILVII